MTSADDARDAALAWLTGRLQWERLLADLHARTEGTADGAGAAAVTTPAPAADEPLAA